MASPQVRNRCWRDFINDSRSGGVTIKFIDSGEVGCTIAERVIADEKKHHLYIAQLISGTAIDYAFLPTK
jgi:hypothetical protein